MTPQGSYPLVALPALIVEPDLANTVAAPMTTALNPDLPTEGPKFDPLDHMDPAQVETLKVFAAKTVREPEFDDTMVTTIIESFGADAVPEVDTMLNAIRNRDASGIDKSIKTVNQNMRLVTRRVPQIDPVYVEKVRQGKVLFQNMSGYISAISKEILEAVDFWSSLKDEFDNSDAELAIHEKNMDTARVAINQVAEREFARAVKQIQLCGTLRLVNSEVGARVGEIQKAKAITTSTQLLEMEERRLTGTMPIMQNALLSLEPLIPMTENNGRIFIDQRNDAALQWFRIWLFRHFGVAQWKVATLIKLNAIASAAADLALEIATDAMNLATSEGTEAYRQQMQRRAQNVHKLMVDLQNVQAESDAVIEAGDLLIEALKEVNSKRDTAARTIERNRGNVLKAHDNWITQLRAIAAGNATATV